MALRRVLTLIIGIWALNAVAEPVTISVAAPVVRPFVYLDDEGQPKGSLVELLAEVEQRSDYQFHLYVVPWARALKEVQGARVDALMPALYNEQRAQSLAYPKQPLLQMLDNVLLYRKSNQPQLSSFAELPESTTVAKLRSMTLDENIAELLAKRQATLVETVDFSAAIAMLDRGKVDYVIADYHIAQATLQQLHLSERIGMLKFTDKVFPSYLAFSKAFAAQHDIDAIMAKIIEVKQQLEQLKLLQEEQQQAFDAGKQ